MASGLDNGAREANKRAVKLLLDEDSELSSNADSEEFNAVKSGRKKKKAGLSHRLKARRASGVEQDTHEVRTHRLPSLGRCC